MKLEQIWGCFERIGPEEPSEKEQSPQRDVAGFDIFPFR
jgi:hypothetical protein